MTTNPRSRVGDPRLAKRLEGELEGEVLFDPFSRGRYATDASLYQIEPVGVAIPKTTADIGRVLEVARDEGVPVLPRGAGTSQCGQAVGAAIVVDVSRHLDRVLDFDSGSRTARVEPGIVLDRLNAWLKPHGLWFPVDVSTASRATIGGMAGNNSCGSRSLRYGTMRDNVAAIEAVLMDGTAMRFAGVPDDAALQGRPQRERALTQRLLALGAREAAEISSQFPAVMRRVGGYNIDALVPDNGVPLSGRLRKLPVPNLAHLLIGSEGTLAFSTAIELKLSPLPTHKVVGICHFQKFYAAMDAAQHIVKLGPAAVEVVDRTLIELARDIPLFRPTIERAVRGTPDALLLVEFAGDDREEQVRSLKRLSELMGDLGYPDSVVEVLAPDFQKAVWDVRTSGLNIMMSMKGDGKPVSFIEDCAVSLEHLAEYTDRLTQVFAKHGTTGTWYAHASVGCLHVRPILNLKSGADVKKMRAIAEEAFQMVRAYKGSHSGEHGDGLVRSEFNEIMFGGRMVRAFEEVKEIFDPQGLMNPGKIVRSPRMDDRSLFRYRPDYRVQPLAAALDWSAWGGFGGAVEMCNNNGECRKSSAGVMCPSFRATGDEQHVTRGRANTLRLAISGQLGPDALVSDALADTMSLCVSCKACKRECPTGVDMARMKIEFLHHYKKRHGIGLRDRLVAYLPRYAPLAARLAPILNLRDRVPGLAMLSEWLLGLSARRKLPAWRSDRFRAGSRPPSSGGREVVLWADTFNTYFEPENIRAAIAVLEAAGSRVHIVAPKDGGRPLCCGRTFLAAGLVDEARTEARRTLEALLPFAERGVPIVGLEPSCLFTFKDELAAMLPGKETETVASRAMMLEEYLAQEAADGRGLPALTSIAGKIIVHGHCHQKAFGAMGAVDKALKLIPGADVTVIDSTCCGMAGAFGYQAETFDVSLRMGELSVLPQMRAAVADAILVADGTSCRHQIRDATGREAVHAARVFERALAPAKPS
ncbi:MAG: FAD-binding oxidoreductase [Rhodospirillales bacterium]|nr:FAD-binding oxidoreductase [Rhodospirillales bacterium]